MQIRVRERPMRDLKRELIIAAERGNADAQLNLGIMLKNRTDDNGYAIEAGQAAVMQAEAVKWLLSAAEQDLPRAQLELAEAYAAGSEPPEDYVRACGWFLVAMTGLNGVHRHRARSGYAQVCARLTAAQIGKATDFAQVRNRTTLGGPSRPSSSTASK
jgi:TPR repeat protein